MVKTALEIAREQERAGTLDPSIRAGIIQKGKTLGVQGAKNYLNTTNDMVTQQPKQDFQIEPELFGQQATIQPVVQPVTPGVVPNIQPVEQTIPQTFSSINPTTGEKFNADGTPYTPTQGTGIAQVDNEIDKLRKEKETVKADTLDSYNIARGNLEKNKQNYLNFDDVNTKYEGILGELRRFEGIIPSETQVQAIADKYGVSVDAVKNPTGLFSTLELSEEGRRATGADRVQFDLDKAQLQFERTKEDLKTSLTNTKQQLTNQIEDTAVQVGRSLAFAEASGVWSGALKSSGYQEGLQNIKEEGDKTLNRLETAIDTTETQNATTLQRLTDDYSTATTLAKQDLDSQLRDIKTDMGPKVSQLERQYGDDSEKLLNALNKIDEEFGTASLDVFSKYLKNMQDIQNITNTNLETQQKLEAIEDERVNKRYNELLENDGIVLLNSSLNTLTEELNAGNITPKRYNDLKRIMQSSITSTLGEIAGENFETLNSADLNTIDSLLNQGMTPTEVVASMQESNKFKPKEEKKFGFTSFDNNLYKTDGDGNISLAIKGTKEVDNKWTKLDDGLYQNEAGETITSQELKQENLLNNKYITAEIGENIGVECGTFARAAAGMTSLPGGNSLNDRVTAFSDTTPKIGGMVLFTGGGYNSTYGHIALVTGINADGTIRVKESNLNNDNVVGERTIDINNANISGYYNNTPLAGGSGNDIKQDNSKELKYAKEELSPSERSKYLKENNLENEYIEYVSNLGGKEEIAVNQKGYTIENREAYDALSTDDKKKVAKSISDVAAFEQSMSKLIDYADKYGTKTLPGTTKMKIQAETRNAMLIAKDLYNLGVLNGPDLALMEDVIPTLVPNRLFVPFEGAFKNEKVLMENAKKIVLGNIMPVITNAGLVKIEETEETQEDTEQDNATDNFENKANDLFDKQK